MKKEPNDLEGGEESYNLLPENLREKADKTAQLVHAGLFGLVAALFIAVLSLPVWFEANAVNELQGKIDSIEKEAKSIKAMQGEVDALVDETKLLIERKIEKPPVVAMLDTLSTLIKDDTWPGLRPVCERTNPDTRRITRRLDANLGLGSIRRLCQRQVCFASHPRQRQQAGAVSNHRRHHQRRK